MTQLGGFYTGVSTFLDSQHPVKDKADADAYMLRYAPAPGDPRAVRCRYRDRKGKRGDGRRRAAIHPRIAISRVRDDVSKRPGYDIRRFHDVVLGAGRVPLAVLERRVRAAFPG